MYPGDVGAGGNRQKEQGEQGGVGVVRRKDFASRSTPALAKPSATTTSQVVMRRPASLLSVEKNGGRGKRRARSEYFGRGPPMEATDWESACSGVWLRRESEEKKEEKEERVSVCKIKEEEQE